MKTYQAFVFASLLALGTCALQAKEISLPPETIFLKPSPLPGYAYANGLCVTCHSADYPTYQPPGMSRTFWTAEVAKMKKAYGATIPDDAAGPIVDYLVKTYGAEASKAPDGKQTAPASAKS